MRQLTFFLLIIVTFVSVNCFASHKGVSINEHNVTWNSPSTRSLESMPVGGGDVGLNVWVEDGDILFYIGQSGAFDENNQMLKHGRVRVKLTPNPFDDYQKFTQTLDLERGCVEIKSTNSKNSVDVLLWVDVFRPVVHFTVEGDREMDVVAQYESWRIKDRLLEKVETHACFSYSEYPGEVMKFKDQITTTDNAVRWMHRNKDNQLVRDMCIKQQGLTSVESEIYDTQTGRTFGGEMWGDQMKSDGTSEGKYLDADYRAYRLKSVAPTNRAEVNIALSVGQFDSVEQWCESLEQTKAEAIKDRKALAKNQKWWSDFWGKSYIYTGGEEKVWELGRNYHLFRYMLACNKTGAFPSKFNGSIFTVDPRGIKPKLKVNVDPDYRAWGGGSFTAQNQRLVYWPMLKNGDFEMMKPQFDFYKNALSSAEARSRVYWNHGGASFTEQLENFGLPVAATWGFETGVRERDPQTERGELTNKYVCHHYVNQLEFAFMILEYYNFSGRDIAEYMPFIKSAVRFFDEHYRYETKRLTGKELGDDGKLVFYPSTAAEMYKIAKNPTDVIVALKSVISRVMDLPKRYVSSDELSYFENLLTLIPDVPFDTKEGHKVIKPAESWEYVSNSEIPEMYAVFPYNQFGLGKDGLDVARNTWHYGESNKKRSFLVSWSQVGIFAARLGMTDEASDLIQGKLGNGKCRFPAFWGPGVDWLPDFNHGGTAMIGIQEMLMQTIDDRILLFPAWNRDWDVSFKLHAPKQTTVEVELKNGEIINMTVTPRSRAKDIVFPQWSKGVE